MQTKECIENGVFIQAGVTIQDVSDSEIPKAKSKREFQKQGKVQNQKIRSSEVQVRQAGIVDKNRNISKTKKQMLKQRGTQMHSLKKTRF